MRWCAVCCRQRLAGTGAVRFQAPAGDALLTPTRIYVKACLAAHAAGGLKALAHITGGGLVENIPRVLPADLGCVLDAGLWPLPAEFAWLARAGGIAADEMARTFNCGIGMAAVVAADRAGDIAAIFEEEGEQVMEIGHIVPYPGSGPRVVIEGAARAWQG
ncbi:MAG: AIR synthase-related protein [Rhodospirillales bacterium]